jgi:DNA (cytosine-5)-methyltransferase 1
MRFLSLFSGIEAASVAWLPLGWECAAVAEIDPFPGALLAYRYPDVPNLGDVTQITNEQIAALGRIDAVIGGSPCQDLSLAGRRAGLKGARSSLFHEQLRIFHAARLLCGARFLVWENVLGAFSTNAGRDFAVVVGSMAGSELDVPRDGWGQEGVALGKQGLVEWAVLDAQWFGVAQRRKRVFAVLDTGDWFNRPPILLEPDSLRGDHPPRRQAWQGVAGSPAAGAAGCGGHNNGLIAPAITSKWSKGTGGPAGDECQNLVAFDTTQITHPMNRSNPQAGDPSPTLSRSAHAPAVAFNIYPAAGQGADLEASQTDVASSLAATAESAKTDRGTRIASASRVRRLTPRECERLQGFPDDWTLVPYGVGVAKDGPRYKALGNSMAVPVMAWIGSRLLEVSGG